MIGSFIRGTGFAARKVCFSLEPEEGGVIFQSGAFLVDQHSGWKAFSSRCPHLGCQLAYDSKNDRFQCPCHGSRFSLDGQRMEGPAQKDMTALDLHPDEKCGTYFVELPPM